MSHRILIADDDEFLTQMYRLAVDGPDRIIEVVHDGEAVLECVKANKPSILVLDLLMPKMDGFTVLRHLQEQGYNFPVIVLSNVNEIVDQEKCRGLGARDFYNKSNTDLDGLGTMIRTYLQEKR